jgi:hypothetical protein
MSDNDILTAPPEQHLHDLRAVHDMANLRLDPASDTGGRPWSVIRLAPAPYSGSETLIGAALNGKTGELVEAATGKPAAEMSFSPGVIEEGSWTAITRIGAPIGKQSGAYKWTEPLDHNRRTIEPADIYRPFAKGGIVLCRHNPQTEGAAQFDSVNLLPPGWESDVQPAFDTLKKNKALTRASTSPADIASLRALVSNSNPIVSSIAFRSLAESGNLDSQTLEQNLSKATNYRRAVLLYLSLIHSPIGGASPAEHALTQAGQGTTQTSESRSAALASATAAFFHPELTGSRSLSASLLSGISSHAIQAPAKDPYVEQLLKIAQPQ